MTESNKKLLAMLSENRRITRSLSSKLQEYSHNNSLHKSFNLQNIYSTPPRNMNTSPTLTPFMSCSTTTSHSHGDSTDEGFVDKKQTEVKQSLKIHMEEDLKCKKEVPKKNNKKTTKKGTKKISKAQTTTLNQKLSQITIEGPHISDATIVMRDSMKNASAKKIKSKTNHSNLNEHTIDIKSESKRKNQTKSKNNSRISTRKVSKAQGQLGLKGEKTQATLNFQGGSVKGGSGKNFEINCMICMVEYIGRYDSV
jgi:hypothetical protein